MPDFNGLQFPKLDSLKKQLQGLVGRQFVYLPDMWVWETDRWNELVYCLLRQCSKQEPGIVRNTVQTLAGLKVLTIADLATPDKSTNSNWVVLEYVLKQYGFNQEESQRAILLLIQTSDSIKKNYGGKIQICLRRRGDTMREELTKAFTGEAASEAEIRSAVTLWLQNVVHMPIPSDRAVAEFCKREECTPEELNQAADELDLNLAVLDVLLELDQLEKESTATGDED